MKYGLVAGRLEPAEKDEFQLAAELGFDGLELVFAAQNYQQNPLWTAAGVADLKAKAAAVGVEIPSVCAVYYNERGLAAPEQEVRETGVEVLRQLIDRCADVGMKSILIACFAKGEIKEPTQENYIVEAMRRCAPKAQQRGITLALETTLPARRFRALLARINHPFVRIYYDLANPVIWGENPAEGLEILADFVVQLHIKDRDADKKVVPLGAGQVDYPAVVKTIRKIGYDGYLVLETLAGDAQVRADFKFIKDQTGV